MNKTTYILAMVFLSLIGCKKTENESDIEKWKNEIRAVEKDFNDMAQAEGLIKAFEFFAAEDGVIRRSKKIIKGKKAIEA